jgi:hypothetical protein
MSRTPMPAAGKRYSDVFVNRLSRGKGYWLEGFIDLAGDFTPPLAD